MYTKLIVGVFVALFTYIGFSTLLKPGALIDFTIQEVKMGLKLCGLDAEIKPSRAANFIFRIWGLLLLLLLGLFVYLYYFGGADRI